MVRAKGSQSAALIVDRSAERAEIIRWYRDRLASTMPPEPQRWEPIKIGPTWQYGPHGWELPEHSMGWEYLAWAGMWLRNAKARTPWAYTMEQARFILWWHAITETGERAYYSAVLQRLKGWGKDPMAAAASVTAAFGPVEFDRWAGADPVGRDVENAWIQITAVSQEQTKNTMKLMPGLIPAETRAYYGIQVGKTSIWGLGDTRQIEAVTASPLALEGGRPTGLIRSETQNWNSSNSGHDMAGAIEGNVAKAELGSSAWILDICNAYRDGEDSVGQRVREAWESTQGDDATSRDFGMLYDSLEAPEDAPLTEDAVPEVVRSIRGDSVWLDADKRILKSILNTANPPSESRRKWYNQIRTAADNWLSRGEVEAITDREKSIAFGEEIAMFLDCSKSDDATALVACRISDGHCAPLGLWQRPPGKRGEGWLVPVRDVENTIEEAFRAYTVVGFFADPSHVRDDETLESIWTPVLDRVHREHRHKLRVWAQQGKDRGHSVIFDMSTAANLRMFVDHVKIVTGEITKEKSFTIDPDARLRAHLLNAKRVPTRMGVSLGKEHRESKRKIDLAISLVGARMVRRIYLNSRKRRGGWAA